MTVPCPQFEPFPFDSSVCDKCGHLGNEHGSLPVEPFHEAMWKVMIAFGGVHSFYAGSPYVDEDPTDRLRKHMARCGINWKSTRPIRMGEVSCFAGTFDDSTYQSTLLGELTCKCGKYWHEEVILPRQTLGQLIWRAVHIDD